MRERNTRDRSASDLVQLLPQTGLGKSRIRGNSIKALLLIIILWGLGISIYHFTTTFQSSACDVNINPRPLEYASRLSDTRPHRPDLKLKNWGVITTIFAVNPAVKQFNRDFPDYGLVVIGDRKTDHGVWRTYSAKFPNVVYLSPDEQLGLGLVSALHIPWDHFGRKSMGYLYAIAHGAESIFDFDDDNQLTVKSFEKTILTKMDPMLVQTTHHLFNPYPHYGPKTDVDGKEAYIWPRGFPLQFIHDRATREVNLTHAPAETSIAIYQGLADHNPDVDAIYRMTSKVPVTFTSGHDQLLLAPPGTFVPWNAQAVLAKHTGFFGLLLPTTVPGRVSDIWRSYILTRLLWETEHRVAFTPAIVTQYRNPHSYQLDLVEEHDLYYKCDDLLAYLAGWTRGDDITSLREAYLDLMHGLVSERFLLPADETLAQSWVRDLDTLGYTWPTCTRHQSAFIPPTPPIVDERTPAAASASVVPDITVPWKKPKNYCYQGKGDWSHCAGENLLYGPTNPPSRLFSRGPYMCTHEPFCWKQLDWLHTDPPLWTCPAPAKKKNLLFWDMSMHDSVMGSAAPTIERHLNPLANTHHHVELCNSKGAEPARRNYPFDYQECPQVDGGSEYLDGGKKVGWIKDYTDDVLANQYKSSFGTNAHFRDDVNALIFGFSPSNFEFWISSNKTLVLGLWHVADKDRCSTASSQRLFDKLRGMATDTTLPHVIGANTLYHREYIRHYTGLNPILLPVTLLSALTGLVDRWKPERPEFLWNARAQIKPPHSNSSFTLVAPKHWTLAGLTKYAGVVIHPYSVTNGKIVEQYALEIPIFAPTPEFSETMLVDRTALDYCPNMSSKEHPAKHRDSPYDFDPNVRVDKDGAEVKDDVKFWASFSEIYHWPCIKYFGSYEELYELLATADRPAMSACMKQANKWRHFEELQNWCWATNYIQTHS